MQEIKFNQLKCKCCGGQLTEQGGIYKCGCCGNVFEKQIVVDFAEQLGAVLNEQKQEAVANLRRQLWQEMHAEYINSARIAELARDIKKYLPDDYFANFCEVANTANDREVNKFLNNTSKEDMTDYADIVLDFMLKSAKAANLTAISLFIERAYKGNPEKYDKYTTKLEEEAEKVNKGVYELILTRDVFLAYSSADIDKVIELCDYLESNKITCFLALRNLRHGRGAVDNYDQAIKTAIDNCKTVVFVSSTNSRSMTCDALTKELPYIRQKDLESAPAEYKRAYDSLPAEYMMPRVEYLIEDYSGDVAEYVTKEFFHGMEWCKSKEGVAVRISKYIIASRNVPPRAENKTETGVKYCKRCRAANSLTAKYCASCGSSVFYADYGEFVNDKIKFCAGCGAQNSGGNKFCAKCGSSQFVATRSEYEALSSDRRRAARENRAREKEARRREKEQKDSANGRMSGAPTRADGFFNTINGLPLVIKIILCLPFLDLFYSLVRLGRGIAKRSASKIIGAVLTIYPFTMVVWLADLWCILTKGRAFMLGN